MTDNYSRFVARKRGSKWYVHDRIAAKPVNASTYPNPERAQENADYYNNFGKSKPILFNDRRADKRTP